MPGELTNTLLDIVKRAGTTTPANADAGYIAKLRKRFESAGGAKIALVDLSHSMADHIGSSGISKIEHLRIALTDLLESHPDMIIIGFGTYSRKLRLDQLPEGFNLWGGTNLAGGIRKAAKLKPSRTVIISDGLPDSQIDAEEEIDHMTGRVDTVYCGPDGHPAVEFLNSLARRCGGEAMQFDGCKELGGIVQRLLSAGNG